MAVFKCKMCGANLNVDSDKKVCTCEYCGSTQTVPSVHSDRIEGMYERANQFRINYEFDKALSIYELILEEENGDADIYWSVFLCKYGVNYVEDALSGKRIPTINRFQYASVYSDLDYKAAIEKATDEQRAVYEEEVKRIAEIQKTFMEISEKEEPFDVFICYKETDDMGRRAVDSVLANEIYHALDKKGIKTFFSRITLEDKLGVDYEPYIFAALNSAKIMIVLGTKPEFFQAVWVKNEWARFISLIKNGAEKTLIPAFKGMDPYSLPEEFAHLQALDMSKLGFMQDLIRGVEKILGKDKIVNEEVQPVQSQSPQGVEAVNLMAYNFLVLGTYEKANELYEQILNYDSSNLDAYLGEIYVKYQVKNMEELEQKLISTTDKIIAEKEKIPTYACDDKSYQLANQYFVEGYYSKEDIVKTLQFNRAYEQKIDDIELYIKELEQYEKTVFKYYLKFASDEKKSEIHDMMDRVIDEVKKIYDNRVEYEKELIEGRTKAYNAFIDIKFNDIVKKNQQAVTTRNVDYQGAVRTIKTSISVYELNSAVNTLKNMGDYEQSGLYIIKGEEKMNTIGNVQSFVAGVSEELLKSNRY